MTAPHRAPRLFSLLLALFPRGFRETFGDDMREVFVDQIRTTRERGGTIAVARLWFRTVLRMIGAAWRERRAGRAPVGRTGLPTAETVRADLRLAARSLVRSPLFTVIAIGAISLGVGAVATIFSAMNALVLRPLPGTVDGMRLVGIDRRTPDWREGVSASGNFYDYLRGRTQSLDGVAAWSRVSLSIATGATSLAVPGNIVSDNYFSVLGLHPALGRLFAAGDSMAATPEPAVVISHRFWAIELGADPGVIGRTVAVNGRPYRLIGVTPEGFRGVFTPLRIDAWVPLAAQPHVRPGRDLTDDPWLWMFGRLRGGIDSERARAELTTLTAVWAESAGSDKFHRFSSARLTPLTGLPDDARQAIMRFGGMLLGAAALVLLIAGANVSSMLAARATTRGPEMGLRTALGASRWRLVRQLLTETLLLFALGAGGGVLVAGGATAALERIPLPGDAALSLQLSPDGRVLVFATLVALVAGVAFGLGPALRGTGRSPVTLLRASSRGSGRRRSKVTSAMIVAQLAASLVLLATAGVFIRALGRGAAIDPGFATAGVATAALDTRIYGYDEASGRTFYDALRRGLERLPDVTAVTFADFVPLSGTPSGGFVTANSSSPGAGTAERVSIRMADVDTAYFETLRIPVLAGRAFAPGDTAAAPAVAVVNDVFARRVWLDGVAVGRTFNQDGRRVTVVGIARSAKQSSLDEETSPFVYFPIAQRWQPNQTVLVRTEGRLPVIADAIQAAVHAIDPRVPTPVVTTLADETSVALLPQRVAALVTGILGIGGLLLAAAGLYGVITYAVSQRTREIGVRMALGARRADVLRLILADGVRLAGVGVVLGLGGAIAMTRVASGYLLGASPMDVPTFAVVSLILIVVAVVASYLPARRAASADPLHALRSD